MYCTLFTPEQIISNLYPLQNLCDENLIRLFNQMGVVMSAMGSQLASSCTALPHLTIRSQAEFSSWAIASRDKRHLREVNVLYSNY